ncbi:MAG: hydantoinase/oxoprolinase family protein [Clostridia bacterium]|nr:hydantoinase/oxoprolinase family protein [Clostridia bacterium]
MRLRIGIDTGGTFTDMVVIDEHGKVTTSKSLCTPHDYTICVEACLEIAAEKLGITVEEMLNQTVSFAYGTTIGTNAIATRTGAKTGMLTTSGCRDVLHIARGLTRWSGLPESDTKHMAATVKPEALIPKELTREITERIDSTGQVVCGLDEEEVKQACKELVEQGVESIAICFLWSFRNPEHEERAQEILTNLYPNIYSSTSHQVIPLEGEYERFITTVLDNYVGPKTKNYTTLLSSHLKRMGLKVSLLLMQADGGIAYADTVQPVASVHSGPAGGVLGAQTIGKLLNYKDIISTDVGGTTFDVSIITNHEVTYSREPRIEKFNTLYPTLDIISIGAGGGSIVWTNPDMKSLHVGPQSAGSSPGPACYGVGGTAPTVTDACMVLGYLNPHSLNGGRMRLYKEKAHEAFQEVADVLGMDVVEVAYGAYEIITAKMSDLIVGMTVRKGLNISDYILLAFGGGGAMHVARMGTMLGAKKVMVPASASVYSAMGLATSPIVHTYQKYDYQMLPITADTLNRNLGELDRKINADFERDGIPEKDRQISFYADMKYSLQINAVTLEIPRKKVYTEEDAAKLADLFDTAYAKMYGEGSGYPAAGRAVVSFMAKGKGEIYPFKLSASVSEHVDASQALSGQRQAYFKDTGFVNTNIYSYERLKSGNKVEGPAIIEAEDTTMLIPPKFVAEVDAYRNVVIEALV